jgi:transketolase
MLLYAALHLAGYERPTLDDLRAFRQLGSVTAGHPEQDMLAGVETTTGPLGQGFATGVGMAIAAERLAAELGAGRRDAAAALAEQRIYAIVSDGDLMEGVASEAASLAGHLRLGRLVYLYDDNRITIDGTTDLSFSEDVSARFDAYGWHTQRVADGNDLDALRSAIAAAQADPRPSLIAVRTTIGYGSPKKAGTSASHGAPLGDDEVVATKAALGWPHANRSPSPTTSGPSRRPHARGAAAHGRVGRALAGLRAATRCGRRLRAPGRPPRAAEGWRDALPLLSGAKATRVQSGSVINALAPVLPELFGGSADLAASNNTDVEGAGDFSADDRSDATCASASASTRWLRPRTASRCTAGTCPTSRRSWCSPTTCGRRCGSRRSCTSGSST